MKKTILFLFLLCSTCFLNAGNVEKTFYFQNPGIQSVGSYKTVTFDHTQLSGLPGEPVLPYQEVALMLPPGEAAESIEIIGENESIIGGSFLLYPQQHVQPVSKGPSGGFIRNEKVYASDGNYPQKPTGQLLTQYLNGYAFALTTFTPVKYIPARGKLSYYQKVTVRIHTQGDVKSQEALNNLSGSPKILARVKGFTQNPEIMNQYPEKKLTKSNYQVLIITPAAFQNGFQPLISMYNNKSMICQVATTETIASNSAGQDLQEKIRNFIIGEYQNNNIEYVLLGGDVEHIPFRGFYCMVQSSSVYIDSIIPADLYYSALDGNWNSNGNNYWGEPGEDDLLPDVSVARFPISTSADLNAMVNKTVSYQTNPVLGELNRPFMVGEHLYDDPYTQGGDYLDLLIDDHTDNGYFTHGIPSAGNSIEKLYDSLISPPNNTWNWSVDSLLAKINRGKQFIHHVGHANQQYMMRLFIWDITNSNFSQVNGTDHNYTLMYTHGCLCGAFEENDCIAEKCLTINNFLAGGVFNSRYGWFNQGTTEGPSEHLHREFVSALYNDTIQEKHIGTTHLISKIKTAPWVTAPGQFEPGATRWCHYCCNVLGDPVMSIWTDEPYGVGIPETSNNALRCFVSPNPATDKIALTFFVEKTTDVRITLYNTMGKQVTETFLLDSQSAGNHTFMIGLAGLSAGMYYCKAETNFSGIVKKIMVVK